MTKGVIERSGPRWQLLAVFTFGVVFLVVMLCIAIWHPNPTPFSRLIFGLVSALAGGGVAALIPGAFSIDLPVQMKAGGAIGVTALVFYVFWQGIPDAPVRPQLPTGVETGWVFVGYVDKNSGSYIEGPYVRIANTNRKLREKYIEAGDEVALNVGRELIITDYRNGGGDAFKSPTEIQGGILRQTDKTGFKLPKDSTWIVRDVVLSGFLESTSVANWIRIAEVPN